MTVALATFVRAWTELRRAYPLLAFLGTLLSGLFTIGMAYVALHAIGAGRVGADFVELAGTADYLGFVAVGAAAYVFSIRLVLWVGRALIVEQRAGTLAALLVSPAGRLPYLVGLAGVAAASALAEVVVLVGAAALLGAPVVPADPAATAVAVAAVAFAGLAIAVVLANVMIVAGEAHLTQNTFIHLVIVLAGFTFPVGYLPGPAQWLAEALPVTSALEFLRTAVAGRDVLAGTPRLALSVALSAGYLLLGLRLLPRSERRAMERSY